MNVFREEGVSEQQIWATVCEYFSSSLLKHVPSIKISSMLYAALARKAVAGQRRPPNRGTANDIEAISFLSPFCDAMFVDRECHALLSDEPLRTEIKLRNPTIFTTRQTGAARFC